MSAPRRTDRDPIAFRSILNAAVVVLKVAVATLLPLLAAEPYIQGILLLYQAVSGLG